MMEGDYAWWFWDHPFPRYTYPVELILGIDESSSGGEAKGNDEPRFEWVNHEGGMVR